MSMVVMVTKASIMVIRLNICTPLPVVTIWVAWIVIWGHIVGSGEMWISLRCCNGVCIGIRLCISAPLPVVTIWVTWIVVWRHIVSSGEMGIGLRCCNGVCIGFRLGISAPLPVVTIWVAWLVVCRRIISPGEMGIGLSAGFRFCCSWHKDSKSCDDEQISLHDEDEMLTG